MTPGTDRPAIVLVHSPLVGALTWQPAADALRARGWRVVVPRLDNDAEAGGSLHRHHAERVRRSVAAEVGTAPVVLVGHSGAGPILPLVATTLVNRVAGYVFVDSDLPRDRASRLDAAPPDFAARIDALSVDGFIPPWTNWWSDDVLGALLPDEDTRERFRSELVPLPRRLFDEPIPVPPEWPDAPCAYLRLSGAYDDAAGLAHREGWEITAVEAGHLHMLVDPAGVATVLEEVVAGFTGERPRRSPDDPILVARRRAAHWVDLGRRVGFGALALALALFGVALWWGLPGVLVQLIVLCLVVACLTLLPSIIVGYGIAAAERDDSALG